MTILAAVMTEKAIYIGTDTLVSWGSGFIRPQDGGKFLDIPTSDVIIAACGDARIELLLGRELRKDENMHLLHIRGRKQVEEMANHLFEIITELGTGGPSENELLSLSMGFIIISRYTPTIWVIESDFSVLEYKDYVSMGSGYELAEGAFYALNTVNITGRRALTKAIETAIARNANCGGEIHIRKLSLKEPKE